MGSPEMHERIANARSAHLATLRPDGAPHLVPIVFATDAHTLFTAIDHKRKSGASLQRLTNIAADPRVSVLVDAYDDDWDALWWVRMDGRGHVMTDAPRRARAIELLTKRYPQYQASPLGGDVIEIQVERWSAWSAISP